MNQQSEHLSKAQIENYGDEPSGPEQDKSGEEQWVEAHLAECPSCRSRVLDFHRTHFALLRDPELPADAQVNMASTSGCPSEDDLRLLAAGLCSDADAIRFTQHAATCDHCGTLLKAYAEDFSDDVNPEQQAVLDKLQSNSAAWQINTARQMARAGAVGAIRTAAADDISPAEARLPGNKSSVKPGRKPLFWRWVLVPAAAAAVMIATIATRRDTPEKTEKLLAQAYTEDRHWAMRFPNTPYAPMHEPREIGGPGQSKISQSHSLLKAEGIIARHQQGPQEVHWLRLRARADILHGKPGAAIAVLSRAVTEHPESISLAMDLAVAYFEQAEASGNSKDYGKAKELLTNVLVREPGNCVALFNRAVVLGRLHMREQAVSDWKTTIQCESDPAWTAEAQEKLDSLTTPGANR